MGAGAAWWAHEETGRTARSGRAAVAAHGGGGGRLARHGNPARAHHEGDDGPSLQGRAVSHQPQPWRGDGPQGLSLRRRSADAGRSRDSHYSGAARARGTGALRQGRRAFRRRAELRVRGGRGRRRRGPAGRDARHRQALRHGGDGSQFGRLRQYRGGAVPHVQPGRRAERPAAAAAGPRARAARRHRAERRHRLLVLRPRAGQGAGLPLRRHDGQRSVPRYARLCRFHSRRRQGQRPADAAGGREEPRHLPARGGEGAQGRRADHRQQDRAVGSRRAGCRLAHGGAGGLLRRAPRDVPALRADRGPRSRRDGGYRRGLRRVRFAIAGGKARRHLHGVGRRGRLDGGCLRRRRPRGSAARCGDAGEDRRAPAGLRHLAEPRRRHGAGAAQDRLRGPRQVRRGVRPRSTASSW